jgi:hypothetical protein
VDRVRAWDREVNRGVLEKTVAELMEATAEACQTLRQNLKAERPSDQLRAAALILEHARAGFEALDLAVELAELRAEVEKHVGRTGPTG